MKLVIGDKNLSSWSMRAWLAAKASSLPFEEINIVLDADDTREKLKLYSPSLKVPCLIDGGTCVWDSLAICEYLAEKAPDKHLWPSDQMARALARSICSEMHSGFPNLRNQLSMDIRLRVEIRHLLPPTVSEIRRVLDIWELCLQKSNGPFLFGGFGIADCFFAPVVMRFVSYGISIDSKTIVSYMRQVQNQDFVTEWVEAAHRETPPVLKF